MAKYGVISVRNFPVFSQSTEKYGPETTPYLDTFHVVLKLVEIRLMVDFLNILNNVISITNIKKRRKKPSKSNSNEVHFMDKISNIVKKSPKKTRNFFV